jgi:radical SAM protein with 4Fe4S-binding SPASM domain
MNWVLYLKTTETCNLNCKHCFTNGVNGPKIYWDTAATIDWLHRFGETAVKSEDTVHCEFHGGEPFLVHPKQMHQVYDSCHHLFNSSWGITSNLVLKLTDDHYDLIRGPFQNRVGTSYDPKIRFSNIKQRELWEKNVKTLLNMGVTIRLFISVTVDTIAIEPIELLKWIRDLGVQEVSFERLTQNGNANLFPEIFPKNIDQDAWFLKMHHQSEQYGARGWFVNDFFENIYSKFETSYTKAGTFCRDCEEKIFTLNADGKISGCPNSAPEFQFGHISDSIADLMTSPLRINNIACERHRDNRCYSCDVFAYCGGDCHQLAWQDDVCGAPKSLMKELKMKHSYKKIWKLKEITNGAN